MRRAIDLIPHRPPLLLVDEVASVGQGSVHAWKHVAVNDPLLGTGGLHGALLVEALAQTAACLMGAEHAAGGGEGRHLGYLVAAQGFEFSGKGKIGDAVELRATRVHGLGALHRFEAEALVDGRTIARGTMTFAVRFDPAT